MSKNRKATFIKKFEKRISAINLASSVEHQI